MYRDIYTYVTEDRQTERILMNAYVVVSQAYYNIDIERNISIRYLYIGKNNNINFVYH